MTMNKDGVTLPALPKSGFYHYDLGVDMGVPAYTEDQMRAYALAALSVRAEPVAVPEAVITGHQAAYACLWRLPSDDPEFHSVRRKLLSVLGGQGSDAQRYALQWAQRTLGASEVSECMWTDAPCTCGGADCEQISFASPPAPSIPAGYRLVPEEPTYWAVFSKSGAHIGLWSDKVWAQCVYEKYEGGTMVPLYKPAADIATAPAQGAK